eukprot:TCONS_00038494-protein
MYIHCTINFRGKSSCRKICTDVRCTFASSQLTPYQCYVWKKKCEPVHSLPLPIDIGLYKDFGELFQSDYMLFWEVSCKSKNGCKTNFRSGKKAGSNCCRTCLCQIARISKGNFAQFFEIARLFC